MLSMPFYQMLILCGFEWGLVTLRTEFRTQRDADRSLPLCAQRFYLQTLVIYKVGFSQEYYTFDSILLQNIVLSTKFP